MWILRREGFVTLYRNAGALRRSMALASSSSERLRVTRLEPGVLGEPLASEVRAFEHRLAMPLGPGRTFRRIHDAEYTRFYRSLGDRYACWVARMDGRIVGTISVSVLTLATGRGRHRRAAIVNNLRIAPEARFGFVVHRLQLAALLWALPRAGAVISIAQDGSVVSPSRQSGKHGVPLFRRVADVALLSIPADGRTAPDEACVSSERVVRRLHGRLSRGRVTPVSGRPSLRSERAPVWLALPDGSACGCVEDNGRAKRVYADDGVELAWRCLSFLAARSDEAAVRLCREAARVAGSIDDSPLRVTVEPRLAARLLEAFDLESGAAIAMGIHGVGVPPLPEGAWSFHASEI